MLLYFQAAHEPLHLTIVLVFFSHLQETTTTRAALTLAWDIAQPLSLLPI